MKTFVTQTPLRDVKVIETQYFRDERGFFTESYHRHRYTELGLADEFVQDNHSRSVYGVVRGLHYQNMIAPMGKLVRCTRGAIFDVAVDLRVGSPTFAQWFGIELTEDNFKQLWVPVGFAHGFATLTEVAEVQYKCTNYYAPSAEGALRWNDPQVDINWLIKTPILSVRDQQAPQLADYLAAPAFRYLA